MDRLRKLCHRDEAAARAKVRVPVRPPRTGPSACGCPARRKCVPCTHNVRHVECVPCVEHVTCYKHVEEQVCGPGDLLPLRAGMRHPDLHGHGAPPGRLRGLPHGQALRPCQETVHGCRMVCHTVEKQVACEAPSTTTCGCESESAQRVRLRARPSRLAHGRADGRPVPPREGLRVLRWRERLRLPLNCSERTHWAAGRHWRRPAALCVF